MEHLKLITADELEKRTGWYTEDCEYFIRLLGNKNLCVVDIKDLAQHNRLLSNAEDDGK